MRTVKTICLCLGFCLLTGCAGVDNEKETDLASVSQVMDRIPEVYENEDGSVTSRIQVNLNGYQSGQDLVTAEVSLQKANRTQAKHVLWREGAHITEHYEEQNEFGQSVMVECWTTPDYVGSLSCGPYSSYISYSRGKLSSYIPGSFRLERRFDDYNADLYSLTDQLAFMTREDAFAKLEDCLKSIGFDIETQYHAYALDKDTLAAEEIHLGKTEGLAEDEYKDSWTEKDECYYFSVWQTYQELPIFYPYCGIITVYGDDAYTAVQAILSRDGIEELTVDQVFDIHSVKPVESMMEFEDIAQAVSDKYNQILGTDTYQLTQAELCYVVENMQMKPAWVLIGTQNDEKRIQTVMDAQTGREIVW